jgi:hypothetical protein
VSDQVTALADLRKQLEAERAAARELCAAVDAYAKLRSHPTASRADVNDAWSRVLAALGSSDTKTEGGGG